MMDFDYNPKPNSHKFKEEQNGAVEKKEIRQVTTGTVKTKKKNEIRKFADVFLSEDIADVKSYIFMDVLVPTIKKAISDIVVGGIDMILYGGSGQAKRSSNSSYVSYRDYSARNGRSPVDTKNSGRGFDYNDLIFESRAEAEAVRDQMEEIIDRYGFVTVADMYEMADPNLTTPYTSAKYGWTSLRNAEAVRGRDGWTLKLPKAMPID